MLSQGQSPQPKRGGLAVDVSSGLIFLKEKECLKKKSSTGSLLYKTIEPTINHYHSVPGARSLLMTEVCPYGRKNVLREKKTMDTTEHDCNDDKERETIGHACELPQSLRSKVEQ